MIGSQHRDRLTPFGDKDFLSAFHTRKQVRKFMIGLACTNGLHLPPYVGDACYLADGPCYLRFLQSYLYGSYLGLDLLRVAGDFTVLWSGRQSGDDVRVGELTPFE